MNEMRTASATADCSSAVSDGVIGLSYGTNCGKPSSGMFAFSYNVDFNA